MSAKNRAGSTSVQHDVYLTPPIVAKACLSTLTRPPDGSSIMEPSAGSGVWIESVSELWGRSYDIEAVELREECLGDLEAVCWDFDEHNLYVGGRFENHMHRKGDGVDLIAGNPPFTFAENFVRHGMYHLRDGGVMGYLLRLNFLGSSGRRKLWEKFPPKFVYILDPRPGFTEDGGTDGTEYAFIVWERGFTGRPTLDWLSTKEEDYEMQAARIRTLAELPW